MEFCKISIRGEFRGELTKEYLNEDTILVGGIIACFPSNEGGHISHWYLKATVHEASHLELKAGDCIELEVTLYGGFYDLDVDEIAYHHISAHSIKRLAEEK